MKKSKKSGGVKRLLSKRRKSSAKSEPKEAKLSQLKGKILSSAEAVDESIPRITNETVAQHREEVLQGARRFIYPLQHSRHRVLIISALLAILLVGSVLTSTFFLLYKAQSTSDFAYKITEIVPFPVTKIGGNFVPYERYLFELRSSLHYTRTHSQEGIDINSSQGEQVIASLKKEALYKTKLDAMAEILADKYKLKVSEQEIDNQITAVSNRGGIGNSKQVLSDVLKDFYDWEIEDLRRVMRVQLLRQKLPRVADKDARKKATDVNTALHNGQPFADLAKQYSDDTNSKEKGGSLGLIVRTNTELPPELIQEAFSLRVGTTSTQPVASSVGYHLVHVSAEKGEEREVSHIFIRFFDIEKYLNDELKKAGTRDYIKI